MKKTYPEQPTIALYEKILSSAWNTMIKNPFLWIVGLVAGILYSGSFLQGAFSQPKIGSTFQLTELTDGTTAPELFASIQVLARQFTQLSAGDQIIAIVIVCVMVFVVLTIMLAAQHSLVLAVEKSREKKTVIGVRTVLAAMNHMHLMRLFGLNALYFLLMAALDIVVFGAILYLLPSTVIAQIILIVAIFTVLLPLTFAANVFFFFVLTHSVKEDLPIGTALMRAKASLKNHWITALELGFVIFVINVVFGVVVTLVNIVTQAVFVPLFSSSLAGDSLFFLIFLGIASTLFIVLGYLLPFGAMTVFNYAAWIEYVHHAERHGIKPLLDRLLHIVKRTS